MSWRIGDHGFRMTLSTRVPDLVEENVGGWMRGWLAENDLGLEDVASWAVHPGGPRILSAVEAAAGLEKERTAVSRAVLAEYGNMSSATVLFTLDRLRSQNAPRPCVALALGPGLVAEAVLIV
jgi:predicted naringenin-chalcone synthase